MDIELHSNVLRLKSVLNKINDASYSYSQISKLRPLSQITENSELLKLQTAYEQIINDLISYLQTTKYGKQNSTA